MKHKLMLVSVLLMFFLGQLSIPVYAIDDQIMKEDNANVINENPNNLEEETDEENETHQQEEISQEKDVVNVSEEEMTNKEKDEALEDTTQNAEEEILQTEETAEVKSQVVRDDDGQLLRYGKWYYLGNFESGRILGTDNRDAWLRQNVTPRVFRLQAAPGNSSTIVSTGERFRIDTRLNPPAGNISGIQVSRFAGAIQMNGRADNDGQDDTLSFRYFTLKSTNINNRYRIQAAALSTGNNGHWFYHGSSNRVDLASNTTSSTFGFFNLIQIGNSEGGVGLVNGESRTTPELLVPATLAATASPGYRFVRWTVNGTGSSVADPTSKSTVFTMGTENATVTAQFERISYTLSTAVSPTNSGSVQAGASSLPQGEITSLQAIPNAGYRFVRWEILGSGSSVANSANASTTFTMGTENATVTAIFEPISTILELKGLKNGDFDFGTIKKSSHAQTLAAKGEGAPLITISDYSESHSWELRVSQPEGLKDEQKNELFGAVIRLKDIQVVDSVHENILLPARSIELSSVQRSVARMVDHGGKKETGLTVLQIGDSKNQTLSGIEMSIPRNTIMNASSYQTTIEWELVGDPTLSDAMRIGGQDEAS